MTTAFQTFYKPKSKQEILSFFKRNHIKVGRLRNASYKQCYAVYCSFFKRKENDGNIHI